MGTPVSSIDQLDYDISVAYIALGVARSTFARSPNADNARIVDDAEAAVNRLLDQRLEVKAA